MYGAFVAAPGRATVLASSAASPAVAQILSASGREAGDGAQGAGGKMTVGDVVPAGHAGAPPPPSILPLVLAGILTDEGASVLVAGRMARRAGLVVAGSVLAGLTATAIVQSWLGVVDGEWVANAAGLSLTVLAISAVVAALHTVLGEAGTALGALTMILVGTRSPRSARRRSSCPGRSAPSASSCRPAPAGTCCPAPHV